MIFKKSFSLLLVIIFICTSVLTQFSWAAETSQATLLEDLSQIEMAIYGVTQEKPLIERVEYLEKELKNAGVPVIHYYSMGKSDNIKAIASEVF